MKEKPFIARRKELRNRIREHLKEVPKSRIMLEKLRLLGITSKNDFERIWFENDNQREVFRILICSAFKSLDPNFFDNKRKEMIFSRVMDFLAISHGDAGAWANSIDKLS